MAYRVECGGGCGATALVSRGIPDPGWVILGTVEEYAACADPGCRARVLQAARRDRPKVDRAKAAVARADERPQHGEWFEALAARQKRGDVDPEGEARRARG